MVSLPLFATLHHGQGGQRSAILAASLDDAVETAIAGVAQGEFSAELVEISVGGKVAFDAADLRREISRRQPRA